MQPGRQGTRGGRLDPKLDIVFWMLFGAEQNRHLLLSLLDAVLQPPAPIEWAEVQHAEPDEPTLVAWARFVTASADEDLET